MKPRTGYASAAYERILVVTNNYHMPRSLLELSQASPDVMFLAYPVTHADLKTDVWLSDPVALAHAVYRIRQIFTGAAALLERRQSGKRICART
jgi:uncharacterized SAM-binding protein YcdF (DUF218 family)